MMRTVLCVSTLSLAAACTAPTPQMIGAFPVISNSKLQVVSDIALTPPAQAALARFTGSDGAFGAMYVTPDGDNWYWRTGAFSLDDADREASIVCNAEQSQPCLRYALLVSANAEQRVGIPARALPDVEEMIRRTSVGQYGALAVMATGSYGYSFNYATPQEAAATALRECEDTARAESTKISQIALPALKRGGGFDCEIFYEFQN